MCLKWEPTILMQVIYLVDLYFENIDRSTVNSCVETQMEQKKSEI